ncbi:MAG TPA: hypothetical protein VK194_10280, partial [Candidatus Deferrimicrobium sp.]|nr:hypothetical protein [Candidatus Deferrimicrobium sp.]
PDQEAVAAVATGSAEAGSGGDVGIGVMDRGFSPKLADAWAAWSDAREQTVTSDGDAFATEAPATSEEPAAPADEGVPATASGEETQRPEPLEVVAVTSSAGSSRPEGILKTMPVSRPMSWLRRGSNNETSKEE